MAENMAQSATALQCAMFCSVLPMVSLWQTLHQPPIAPYPNMAHLWRKHGAMLHLLANAPCFGLVYLFRWGQLWAELPANCQIRFYAQPSTAAKPPAQIRIQTGAGFISLSAQQAARVGNLTMRMQASRKHYALALTLPYQQHRHAKPRVFAACSTCLSRIVPQPLRQQAGSR